jgi:hypothetical protein
VIIKYRIVKRKVNRYYYYYAQTNILGIWVDLRFHPFVDTYDAHDVHFDTVDNWLKDYIKGKPDVDEVVKTYD